MLLACGKSGLGLQPSKLATRVQIPATALNSSSDYQVFEFSWSTRRVERAGLSSLDLVPETVRVLKVRLEGLGVPIGHSLQSWIEREHEVAE